MAELVTMNPYHPDTRALKRVAEVIRDGGVAVVPTDTVYALVASAFDRSAPEQLYRLKGIEASDPRKPLSVMVHSLKQAAEFTRGIPTPGYRMMRRVLPGPYTFVLAAGRKLPAAALQGRKTIGIRIPDCAVTLALLEEIGLPLLATSVVHYGEHTVLDDPVDIAAHAGDGIDVIVDIGPIFPEPSTVIDLTGKEPVVLREGKGSLDNL